VTFDSLREKGLLICGKLGLLEIPAVTSTTLLLEDNNECATSGKKEATFVKLRRGIFVIPSSPVTGDDSAPCGGGR